jgi:hypothetical protein
MRFRVEEESRSEYVEWHWYSCFLLQYSLVRSLCNAVLSMFTVSVSFMVVV